MGVGGQTSHWERPALDWTHWETLGSLLPSVLLFSLHLSFLLGCERCVVSQ